MMKRHFYSDSRLARFIEKITSHNKPTALPWDDWREWKKEEKKNNPVGYFINNTLADTIDNVIWFMFGWFFKLRIYYYNVKNKSHYIDPKLNKGQYYDPDYLLEKTMFEFIVDFVEIEAAHAVMDNKQYVWVDGRCPQAGLDYFETVVPEFQKVVEIYHFWKKICRDEQTPEEEEYEAYLEELSQKYDKQHIDIIIGSSITSSEREKLRQLRQAAATKDDEIENKKTEYLHDIIDLRKNFWT